MSEHALLSPSAAVRWVNCPGSVAMSIGEPDSVGDAARWGTAAHEVAAWTLDAWKTAGNAPQAEQFRGRVIEVEGHQYEVDEDMLEQVQTYVDGVIALCQAEGAGPDELLVEHKLDFSDWLPAHLIEQHGRQFGTADTIILGRNLVVIDFKTGQKLVSPESMQLKLYTAAALRDFPAYDSATSGIIQPPKGDEAWLAEHSLAELEEVVRKVSLAGDVALQLIGKTVEELNVYLVPGAEQCQYCRAKAKCPKLFAAVSEAVFDDLDALGREGGDLLPVVPWKVEDLALAYKRIELVEQWVSAVRERAYGHKINGGDLPGFKLVAGRKGARKWSNEAAVKQMLLSLRLPEDTIYTKKLVSPTTLEKELKSSPAQWEQLKAHIEQAEGKPVLVPETAKGEPIVVTPVSEQFENLADGSDLV